MKEYSSFVSLGLDMGIDFSASAGGGYKGLNNDLSAKYVLACIAKAKCIVCNTFYGEALGHLFENYVSDNNATCTADGTKTAVCSRAGCNVEDTTTDAGSKLPHTPGVWTISKHASEDEEGEKVQKCTVCDGIIDTIVIEKLSEWVSPFTDVNDDNWYYTAVRWANAMGMINGMSADSFYRALT